jgi:hypothetical protein
MVVIMAQILRAFRQKGKCLLLHTNLSCCSVINRVCTIAEIQPLKDSNCDEMFRNFISSVSEIPLAKWQKHVW